MNELWVWMNGERVGTWHRGRTGYHRFTYADTWLTSSRVRSLSLSLPIGMSRMLEGEVVANYFDNLLPDSDAIRKRLASRFHTKSVEAFELLCAIGRDCVGAVQLLPPHESPTGHDRLDYSMLTEAEVEQLLQRTTATPVLGSREEDWDDFRISLAGAQEKTALLCVGQQWCRPKGATPTTHILKLPLGLVGGRNIDLTHSVENEWLCGRILNELGLATAGSTIANFGNQKVLVVERFDRQFVDSNWIARLPQEDFCQVLGKAPVQKYEVDGGPSQLDILKVLSKSAAPAADSLAFLSAQLAFWLLAATDGHAKNFSIFLLPGDRYRLTPFYDVLSAWPVIGPGADQIPWHKARMAMAVHAKNKHYNLAEIQVQHWRHLAVKSGVAGVWQAMLELVEGADAALDRVMASLAADFPAHTADAIRSGVQKQRNAFLGAAQSLG